MPSAALATTGSVLTATEYNYLPRGVLGASAALTSSFTTSATHTTYQDVTNLSASITYAANRILRVTIEVNPTPSGGIQRMLYKIIRGSTDLREFEIAAAALDTTSASGYSFTYTFNGPSSGATETFKVQLKAGTNNTAVQNYGAATFVSRLIVEDLGSQ